MTETLKQKLNDSKATRWGALLIVAFTMMATYYVNDVVAPLKTMLEAELSWTSSEFGFFTGAYSFLNVFLLMLIWGGLILDRFGIRFTGKLATILMVGGTALEYYAMTGLAGNETVVFGYKLGVLVASAGYSIFGVGAEVAGITTTKIIAKWFKGKEMATAMGVQVALARIGSQAGYAVAIPMARSLGLSAPVLLGLVLLIGGLIAFFAFSILDKKLDKQLKTVSVETNNVDAVEKASKNLLALISENVYLKASYGAMRPIYVFTKLDDIKNQMINDATIRAKSAAEQFAKDSNVKVGKIKKANQGVFVITGRNKASQYGNDEMYQKNKEIRVVSTIEYYLK